MISREDFTFTIGYRGNTAIVNGSLKRKYSKMSALELAERGMFKQAICYALYTASNEDLESILEMYNEHNENKIQDTEELKRIFGITRIPEEVTKVIPM
ncbi:MAG: hypothetical protein DRP57_08285 [Spirochaetes bacterium]|nr:MAG: hypothetical protein DRP57_08285 [Spirochaetota bacterium]